MDTDTFEKHLFSNGTFDVRRWRWAVRKFPDLVELPGGSPSEKAWLFTYKRRPICFCGKETHYVNFAVGYRTTCSRRCAQSNPVMVFEKRYRLENLWASDKWKERTSQKMKEAHFKNRTSKKLAQLTEKEIIPLDEVIPGQANEYRWQHSCGEIFVKPFSRVKSIYCPVCHVSQGQGEMYEAIRCIYDGRIIANDRTAIAPKEIDVYLPDLKLGFEFNGKYWHPGDGSRELEKSAECEEADIQLIHIWEQEWIKDRAASLRKIESALLPRK